MDKVCGVVGGRKLVGVGIFLSRVRLLSAFSNVLVKKKLNFTTNVDIISILFCKRILLQQVTILASTEVI